MDDLTEVIVRVGALTAVFLILSLWELAAPRRNQPLGRRTRWPGNIGIVVLDTVLLRLVFPITAVGMGLLAEARGWGLFNHLAAPGWIAVVASVILLDLAIYL